MNYKYQIAPFDNHDIKKLFSPKCLQFITDLHIRFNKNRIELLDKRKEIQKKIDSKENIIIGINKFIETKDTEPDLLNINSREVKKQITDLHNIKKCCTDLDKIC